KLTKQMSLVVKDVDTLAYAIQEKETLGMKIDDNGRRLANVEETLASLLKAQQEQNATNKALT
ncbi:hypothetical protein Dimus_010744, partial [Dionaea muscipula]